MQQLQEKSANCGGTASWQQGGIARSYRDSWIQVQPDFDKQYFSHYVNCISLTISIVFLSLCQLYFCHMYRAALEGHSETVGEPGVNSGQTLPSLKKVWRKIVATWMLQKEVIKMRCTMQDLGGLLLIQRLLILSNNLEYQLGNLTRTILVFIK